MRANGLGRCLDFTLTEHLIDVPRMETAIQDVAGAFGVALGLKIATKMACEALKPQVYIAQIIMLGCVSIGLSPPA